MTRLCDSSLIRAAIAVGALVAASAGPALADPVAPAGFTLKTFATAPDAQTTGPDDIAYLDGLVFVGWQNGVGTKGEPSPTGQVDSTLVAYDRWGDAVRSWSLRGKLDGMAGDPWTGTVIATANEDGNSSIYTVSPWSRRHDGVRHFIYSPAPDSASTGGVFTGGGTDSVVVKDGRIFTSASNPTPANATALFRVKLDPYAGVARLFPTFADDATATDALSGQTVTLALTDPDSNALVPWSSPEFGGDIMLDSQADQQLVFADSSFSLTRLSMSHGGMSAGTDDVRWAAHAGGTLYIVDNGANTVYQLRGPFQAGQAFASLDTVGAAADGTEVDTLDLSTGVLTPFVTGLQVSKGLLWVGGHSHRRGRPWWFGAGRAARW